MMHFLAPILVIVSLVLACFTAPDGNGVWVNTGEITSVTHAQDGAAGANSKITTTGGASYFVHETPQEALKIIETSEHSK
jgi:hypothetical protein